MLRVIVGQTFHGTLTPLPRDATPQHEPPAVVTGPDDARRPTCRAAKQKVDFHVLAPTVREDRPPRSTRSSRRAPTGSDAATTRSASSTTPAGNEYWGIQEIGWEDPPILDGPSVTQTINGREYSLYFSGSKLHMVAFQAERRRLLGREHAPRPALQRDDARDRQGPEAPGRSK